MEKYIQIRDGLNDIGHLVPESALVDKSYQVLFSGGADRDMYASLFWFPQEAKDYVDANGGSIKGYHGKAYSNRLFFDLDSKLDVNKAKEDAKELLYRLQQVGIKIEEHVRVYFSGNKGFHIEVPVNATYEPEEMKSLCSSIAAGLDSFDDVIYNTSRIIRITNTKHQASGLYKIELEPYDLTQLSIEQIKLKAQQKSGTYQVTPVEDVSVLDKFKKPVFTKPQSVIVSSAAVDGIRGLDEIDFAQCPKTKPRCIFALEHGVMVPGVGERSALYLRLATYYRNQGMAKEVAYNALKGISRLNSRLYPEAEPFSKDELWNTAINSAYSKTWKQIPGAFGSDPNNDIVKKYCDASGKFTSKPCCVHHQIQAENSTVQINEVSDAFDHFAANFDKNTVKTGIEFIDKNMQITTGTTNLLVGAAGCHRKGEKVLMFNGSIKNVEDVMVGELLMGPDSKPRKVLRLVRGEEAMYKVTFDTTRTVKNKPKYFNESHTLHLLDNNKGEVIKQISIKDYVNEYPTWRKERCYFLRNSANFPKKDLIVDPYILGMWLGDGHSNAARFTFKDRELIKTLKAYAKTMKVSYKTHKPKNRCSNHSVTGNGIFVNKLKKLNIFKNKHIPQEYLTSSKEQRLALLAGLIDTDGYVSKNCVEIAQKNEVLAQNIQHLCFSLGIQATLVKRTKVCTNSKFGKVKGEYNILTLSGNLEEIPTKIKRKKLSPREQIKNVNRLSFNIQKVSDKEAYYGFTVSDDNLYLDDDFLVIKNCGKTTLALNILESSNINNQPSVFFSMDMHKNLIYLKLAMKHTNYTKDQIFKFHKEKNKQKIEEIKDIITKSYKLTHFDFSTTLTLEQMRDKIFDIEQKTGQKIKFALIDYAGRISGPYSDVYANSNFNALKSVEVANVTDTATIILSQISRQTGDGSTPIRTKRAAKESGTWEESATNVLTMWRPFMGDADRDDVMRIFLAKNRMGSELEQVLYWDGSKSIIRDMSFDELADYNGTRGDKAEREYLRAKTGKFIQTD